MFIRFEVVRAEPDFIELRWEQSLIFLERVEDYSELAKMPVVNIRAMVPNVDDYWCKAIVNNARIIRTIDDRHYGFVISPSQGRRALRCASRRHLPAGRIVDSPRDSFRSEGRARPMRLVRRPDLP
jgi:hypothetical protein